MAEQDNAPIGVHASAEQEPVAAEFVGVTAIMPQKVTHRLVAMEVYDKRTRCTNTGWGFFSAATGFWIAYSTLGTMQVPLALAGCVIFTVLSAWGFLQAAIADAEMRQGTMEVDAARLFSAAGSFAVAGEEDYEGLPWHVKTRLWIGQRLRLVPVSRSRLAVRQHKAE